MALIATSTVGVVVGTATTAGATLSAVGPVDGRTGFPTWYQDNNGVALGPCYDPALCTGPLPNPSAPPSTPSNVPAEGFYFRATSTMASGSSGKALLALAVETSFLPSGTPTAGQQVTFARIRVRASNLVPGASYTVTHPYGRLTLTASSLGALNDTVDVGCKAGPCNFATALGTTIGPWLKWDPAVAPAAPAGHLGNPFTAHPVVGSPLNTNFFRITGPAVGGPGVPAISTNQFNVEGTLLSGASFTAAPGSLTFPTVPVGAASGTQRVTIGNGGNAPMTVNSVTIGGANPADFAVAAQTCTAAPVAAGRSCTADVQFAPTASGTRTATLDVVDNAPGSPHSVPLTGSSSAAIASVSPTSLAFGTLALGATSAAQTVTVTNNGGADLNVSSVVVGGANPGDFPHTEGCTAGPVASGSSCTITVQFSPGAGGARSAAITLTDNAGDSPQTVALSGTGSAAAASVTPPSLTFGSTPVGSTSASQSVTITSTGNQNFTIHGASITGSNPNDFAITGGCTSIVLPPGGKCTISVAFTPTAAGSRQGVLSIDDDGGGHAVPLSGTATSNDVTASPGRLAFGSTPRNTSTAPQDVTVTNTSATDASITSVTLTGPQARNFVIRANTCSSTLPAGGSCTISVAFAPVDKGNLGASLSIVDSAGTQSVALGGTSTV